MDAERFIQYLDKRGINHLGKSMTLVFPVFDSESRTFSLYICAHSILSVENECNPTYTDKLLSLLSSQKSEFDDTNTWSLSKAAN